MKTESTHDKIALLRMAFKGLDEDELQEIAALSRLSNYDFNHTLCHEGEYENTFYIVADGRVVITQKMSEGGEERVLRVGGKGDMIGEMALIQSVPRSASVRTTTECTMLEMGKKDFEIILKQNPRMAMDITRITLDRLRENDQTTIKDLQKTNKVLRQLDRNKLEFIQVAAHELRTPLTVLKGYVDMLHSFPDVKENDSLSGMLSGISKGADRMHEVVNTMLDVTRIDKNILNLASVPILVKLIIFDIVVSLEKDLEERNIEILINHIEDVPNIYADPDMVEKALYHLIINAIKYTPDDGKIFISTKNIIMADGRSGIEIKIKDRGIGLDEEHHDLIFEKFYQVQSVDIHSSGKTTFKGGGAGLGLAIVQGVIKAHKGKVWVESEGHDEDNFLGSTFYIHFPLNFPSEKSTK
ncbi:MAG: cyclic nucleotide-binding domain-containing protein [Anaerolineae bacterium]|nr:cyclic nucleotide-binding domain-containing protein [Anaerolineae bacterium]MBT7073589.1 cyclic nucleotide-binding domain-containing protein [Anaerolineae bacterium]MBT7781445.1 cyclic nucleotide-binding domain-containing protein [Anaerolineae bacterium]